MAFLRRVHRKVIDVSNNVNKKLTYLLELVYPGFVIHLSLLKMAVHFGLGVYVLFYVTNVHKFVLTEAVWKQDLAGFLVILQVLDMCP